MLASPFEITNKTWLQWFDEARDEICKKTKIPSSGELTKKLKELENCGFIRKYIPFGAESKNALYQLIDNYTLFYNRLLKTNRYNENYWKSANNSGEVNAWSGVAFERVCLEHIPQIKNALGISGVQTDVNSWRCEADSEKGLQGSQIDLLIVRFVLGIVIVGLETGCFTHIRPDSE